MRFALTRRGCALAPNRLAARGKASPRARCGARGAAPSFSHAQRRRAEHDAKRAAAGVVSWAPWASARSAGLFGRRAAPSTTDFVALSERSERSERSEFDTSRKDRAPQRTPRLRRGATPSGPPFFAYFLSGKRKKVSRLSGRTPDADSPSGEPIQQRSRRNRARTSTSSVRTECSAGRRHATSTGSVRTG